MPRAGSRRRWTCTIRRSRCWRRRSHPDDDVVLAHAHNRLGHVLNCADDAPAAITAHRRALDVLHRAGRADLEPEVLIDLGYTLWGSGALRGGRGGVPRRASPCWRSRAVATNAAGRTPRRGSAWSSRTWAGWTRRWPTSGRRSRRSSGSAARTTPTPPRRSTSSATPCGCRAGSTRPSTRTGAASACSNACSGRTTRASAMALTNLGLALADAGDVGPGRRHPDPGARDLRRGARPHPLEHAAGRLSGSPTHWSRRGGRSARERSGPRSTRRRPNGSRTKSRPGRADSGRADARPSARAAFARRLQARRRTVVASPNARCARSSHDDLHREGPCRDDPS